jgi:CHAD domain-containing protein
MIFPKWPVERFDMQAPRHGAPLDADALTLELELPVAGAALLWRHAALAGRPRPRPVTERWVWLDTPDRRLCDRNLALRDAPRGPRRLCPLMPPEGFRLPGTVAGPEVVLPAGGEPDGLDDAALETLARWSGRLQSSGAEAGGVSMQLRIGRIEAGASGLEVARLTLWGPASAVLALGTALAETLPLLPAVASLDETARALALGEPPRMIRRGAPDLGSAATPDEALSLAISHLAEVLLAHAPMARVDAGPTGVHQLRVAARRLRSCLKLFRRTHSGAELEALESGVREVARGLTDAREWDVFLDGLAAELSAVLGSEPRWNRLVRAAQQRRQAAYESVGRMLAGTEFRGLVWCAMKLAALRGWDAAPTAREAPLRPWAAALLAKRGRRLKKDARHIEVASDTALHDLRLEAKKLRYAAELFAPLWPGRTARRYLRRLSALQEALGLSNDAVVARQRVAALSSGRRAEADASAASSATASAWAIGLAEGWALAAGREMRPEALKAWRRFARSTSFWRDDLPPKRSETKPPVLEPEQA